MTLEKKLVRLRKKEGMSQADVSEKLDVSRQSVSRWEAGDSRPSTENLQALCKLYNVKLDDLLDESNEEVPIEKPECQKAECDIECKDKEKRHVWATVTYTGMPAGMSRVFRVQAGKSKSMEVNKARAGVQYYADFQTDDGSFEGICSVRISDTPFN